MDGLGSGGGTDRFRYKLHNGPNPEEINSLVVVQLPPSLSPKISEWKMLSIPLYDNVSVHLFPLRHSSTGILLVQDEGSLVAGA